MALYMIRREVTGATQEDIDAASFRAVVCAYAYEGFAWIRSFWDQERQQVFCIYEAKATNDIEEHALRAQIPCDEIRPIVEIGPWMYQAEESSPQAIPGPV